MADLDHILSAGMSALVANMETRQAIIEYIKTLTEEHKPKEQLWREVYWWQSEETRINPVEDVISLIKNGKCRLMVKGFWDEYSRIGRLVAYFSSENDYQEYNSYYGYGHNYLSDIDTEVMPVKGYMEIIRAADLWRSVVYEKWMKITLPLPEDTK